MDLLAFEKNFLEQKKAADIFDINCYIPDYRDSFLWDNPATPEQILKEGVNRLVLADKHCISDADRVLANENLLQYVAKNDAFYAAPIIQPEMDLIGEDFEAYLDYLIKNKAVIIRVFPKEFKHSLKKWQMGRIFTAMEKRRMPLMVWHTQTDWDTIAEIAEAFPKMPIIIEGSDQKTIYYVRDVMGLCERFKSIYLEMHNFTQYRFLPYALEFVGADRLLFGSFSPYNDMNGVLQMIFTHADEKQRELILSKNMDRLISEIVK